MSWHCGSKWTFEDAIEEAPITEIAGGVRHHGYSAPGVYGIFCTADQFVYNIGIFLQKHRGQELTRALVEASVPAFEFKEKAVEIVVRVLTELDLLGKTQPLPPPLPKDAFSKISIPRIKKPFPPLSITGSEESASLIKRLFPEEVEKRSPES